MLADEVEVNASHHAPVRLHIIHMIASWIILKTTNTHVEASPSTMIQE